METKVPRLLDFRGSPLNEPRFPGFLLFIEKFLLLMEAKFLEKMLTGKGEGLQVAYPKKLLIAGGQGSRLLS